MCRSRCLRYQTRFVEELPVFWCLKVTRSRTNLGRLNYSTDLRIKLAPIVYRRVGALRQRGVWIRFGFKGPRQSTKCNSHDGNP